MSLKNSGVYSCVSHFFDLHLCILNFLNDNYNVKHNRFCAKVTTSNGLLRT